MAELIGKAKCRAAARNANAATEPRVTELIPDIAEVVDSRASAWRAIPRRAPHPRQNGRRENATRGVRTSRRHRAPPGARAVPSASPCGAIRWRDRSSFAAPRSTISRHEIAVPHGASSLLTWWVSRWKTCNPACASAELHLMSRRASALPARPGRIGSVKQARAACVRPARSYRGSSSYQPVVPTTIFAPCARQARMFCTTASGVVKSMTTSNPATKGGVSAAAS